MHLIECELSHEHALCVLPHSPTQPQSARAHTHRRGDDREAEGAPVARVLLMGSSQSQAPPAADAGLRGRGVAELVCEDLCVEYSSAAADMVAQGLAPALE